jgi:hypothetical protein
MALETSKKNRFSPYFIIHTQKPFLPLFIHLQKKQLKSLKVSHLLNKEFIKSLLNNRWFRFIGNLASLFFCSIFVIENLQKVIDAITNTNINFLMLFFAWLVTFITVMFGAVAWWFTLRGFGAQTNLGRAIKIHLISSISKYIPGYAWQYVSKGFLSIKDNIPTYTAGVAILWEFFQIFWTGVNISLITVPNFILDTFNLVIEWSTILRVVGIILLPAPIAIINFRPQWIFKKRDLPGRIEIKWLAVSSGIVCLGWFFLGGSLEIILLAFGYPASNGLPYLTFTITASLLLGILVIPVPNGLGIREGLIVYFLSKHISVPVAILVAAFSRLAITSGELLGVLIVKIRETNPKE